jgi:His/Glu/Gln/Arg/opine family amino acid ABC transporter permease subunit
MLGFRFRPVLENIDFMIQGVGITFSLSVLGFIFGSLIGIFIAFGRKSKINLIKIPSKAFIELVRNTPFLVHIYFFYFALGAIGINLPSYFSLLVALIIMNAGYMAEIIRGGIEVIKSEQIKSAEALGLSSWQVKRYVIVPPVLRVVLPPALNQFAITFLSSSLGVVVGVKELTWRADFLQARNFLSLESYLVAAVFYILVVKFTLVSSRYLDKRIFKYSVKDI